MSGAKRKAIFISDQTHYRLKLACAQRRIHMTQVVGAAINAWLRDPVDVRCEGDRSDRTRNVFMDDATHRALRMECAARLIRMTDVVDHVLEQWLAENPLEGDAATG